jgi:hypothetical protein
MIKEMIYVIGIKITNKWIFGFKSINPELCIFSKKTRKITEKPKVKAIDSS